MIYAFAAVLTFVSLCFILIIIKKKTKQTFKVTIERQSDMHNALKEFFSRSITDSNESLSQMKQRKEKENIRIIIVEDKAYWVVDNIFYVADAINGNVNADSSKPVETENMSKKDIKKMLFILDNLKNGNSNDSGSSGNKRI